MAQKTVLVTGANGFLGRATVSALTAAGWRVTKGLKDAAEDLSGDSVRLDLCQPETVLALQSMRFDAIVHLGARVELSGATEAQLFVPNVLATGCLAHLAAVWNAHLLFASTAVVHGLRTEHICAATPVTADTPYARSKWLAEELLAASGSRHCVFRIGGIFGANGPEHLGLNRAITGAVQGVAPTRIGSGQALRNYVYVKDVAKAIAHALLEEMTGTHLVAGGETLSVAKMLQEVCNIFTPGAEVVVKDGPEAASQVIEPSSCLPGTRCFREALFDILKDVGR